MSMMRPFSQRRRAFTLLEVLIATGIFMVVMVIAVGVFTQNVGSSSTTEQLRVTSQSARFAFESISREIRLSHGLVFSVNTDAKMVIPPFDIADDQYAKAHGVANPGKIIHIYRIEKLVDGTGATLTTANGETLYSLSRKTYCYDREPSSPSYQQLLLLTKSIYTDQATAKTASQYYTLLTTQGNGGSVPSLDELFGLSGTNCSTQSDPELQSVLPKDLRVEQFTIDNFGLYPAIGASLSTLTGQPYIQIGLSVSNPQYNANREDNQKIRTTLQTMIVPRNFLSPYEAVQTGVQGANP